MLAGELKKFDLKVAAGEAQPPPQVPSAAPPSLSGLHISGPVSQSLPAAGAHLSGGGFLPPKPRVRPAAPTLSQLPNADALAFVVEDDSDSQSLGALLKAAGPREGALPSIDVSADYSAIYTFLRNSKVTFP